MTDLHRKMGTCSLMHVPGSDSRMRLDTDTMNAGFTSMGSRGRSRHTGGPEVTCKEKRTFQQCPQFNI